jgi:thioesterase domain-containing protein
MASTDDLLQVIADEVGVDVDELVDDCTFKELGVDNLLTAVILTIAHDKLCLQLSPSIFRDYPTISDLRTHLGEKAPSTNSGANTAPSPSAASVPSIGKQDPLSVVLQGKPRTCSKVMFLLPDGSGSAMAYARLPRVDADICIVALNSPYLRAPSSTRYQVANLANRWADEVQLHQPHGPYYLGGWSAGGYYAFEVAKHLISRCEKVESLVLIDSPCRLIYEALPMEVVHYLSNNNLMGNWGSKSPPAWMVNHFGIAIRAIEEYQPTPLRAVDMPGVFIIWAEEGMLKSDDAPPLELNMNVQVTRMLIERPEIDGAMGWDQLFPGAEVEVAKMAGNHFTLVYPPYVSASSQEYVIVWATSNLDCSVSFCLACFEMPQWTQTRKDAINGRSVDLDDSL